MAREISRELVAPQNIDPLLRAYGVTPFARLTVFGSHVKSPEQRRLWAAIKSVYYIATHCAYAVSGNIGYRGQLEKFYVSTLRIIAYSVMIDRKRLELKWMTPTGAAMYLRDHDGGIEDLPPAPIIELYTRQAFIHLITYGESETSVREIVKPGECTPIAAHSCQTAASPREECECACGGENHGFSEHQQKRAFGSTDDSQSTQLRPERTTYYR